MPNRTTITNNITTHTLELKIEREGFTGTSVVTKRIGYSSETEFLVQVGYAKGAYHTRYRIIGNISQALLLYQGINVGNGYKKRLYMPAAKHPVVLKQSP